MEIKFDTDKIKSIKENIILILRRYVTKENITLFLSLIGAAAWFSPFLYENLQEPQLDARLVGLTWSPGMYYNTYDPLNNYNITLQGVGYFPKITIVSLKKDFNIKYVEVLIKYHGERELQNGDIFSPKQSNMTFAGKGKRILKIPPSEHINSLIVLENGKPVSVFVPFIVNKSVNENFEFIEFRFYEFDGSIETIKMDKKDIDVKNMYFEEKYWE